MNPKILYHLEELFDQSITSSQGATIDQLLTDYIYETNQHYLSLGINHYLEDEEPIQLKKLKSNTELKDAFENALRFNFDDDQLISNFKIELSTAFSEIRSKLLLEDNKIKNQVIFLEYDFLPIASISGFEKGDYPLLTTPQYLDDYPKQQIYTHFEKIDYRQVWKNLMSLISILEEFEIDDLIMETDIYQALHNAYIFKTYILLHKAFDQLGITLLDGIEIEKPVMVYGNEHDCEQMSIYVFE